MAEFPHPIGQRAGKRIFPFLGHISLRPQSAGERPLVPRKNTFGVTLRMAAQHEAGATRPLGSVDRSADCYADSVPWGVPPLGMRRRGFE